MDIIEQLETIIGKPANRKNFPDRPGDPRVLVADASKAKRELGWEAAIGLEEGLKRTCEYFLHSTNQS